MEINALKTQIGQIKEFGPAGKAAEQTQKAEGPGSAFLDMIKEVNEMQLEADRQIEGVTTGAPGFNTHTAMIALEKADISFQLMNAIRGKLVRAYEEVMRTQL
ncbi:MAG: flagellar hook-basal body complex protein FliE [Bdellovibrionales bacterium]|nr:flagellar hook-basal body complex protein FliE [Bdellovibrionales bacterium]